MIGCLRTRVRKQPIIALYFESELVLKFYNLKARGIFPLSTEIWNRWASPGASSSAAVFRSLAGMQSCPVALWGFKSLKSFCMPFGSTLMGGALSTLMGGALSTLMGGALIYRH